MSPYFDEEEVESMALNPEPEEEEYPLTKAQRREAKRTRNRLGMVKHSEGSERAPKFRKPTVRVVDKTLFGS